MYYYTICLLFSVIIESHCYYQCGLSQVGNRIIGGEVASHMSFPWMAYLDIEMRNISTISRGNCGGSLISDEWVLTAAHCVTDGYSFATSNSLVTLGEHDTFRFDGTEYILNASMIIFHSGYSPFTHENDIALIKLSEKINFKYHPYIQPICLPRNDLVSNKDNCYVSGWGRYDQRHMDTSSVLKYAKQMFVDIYTCKDKVSRYEHFGHMPVVNGDKQFCANGDYGTATSCHGDSGGPFQCQLFNNGWVLEGLTSFGNAYCTPNDPGVYTKVAYYMDWIREVTNVNFP